MMDKSKRDFRMVSCYAKRLRLRSNTLTPRDMLNRAIEVLEEQTGELFYAHKSDAEPMVVEVCPKESLKTYDRNERFEEYQKLDPEPETCGDDCVHTFKQLRGRPSARGQLVQGNKVLYEVKQTMDCIYGEDGNADQVVITPGPDAPEGVLSSDLESRF